jgi:alkanesulfonate monooxygenase SsuD/methylene tetrahydromethanopterin reductase-like flavin-dependent oxidoreductase (luciferase family)
LVEEADRLGIGSFWLSEHHFFEDGYLTQPFTMLAAMAARTKTARLGTAIVLAALRHPQHLAEEAILVDLLSGGRLEIGFGAGYRVPEYEAFDKDITRRYTLTDAAMREVQRLLESGVLTPPPVQQPIPLWLGYQGPQGARRAGRLGVGLLSLDRRLLLPYQEALATAGLPLEAARMGGVIDILVADDPERAFETVLPFYAYQTNTYRSYGAEGTGQPAPPELTLEKLRSRQKEPGQIPGLRVLTADAAIAAIRDAVEGLPVEHVYCWGSIAGMPNDLAARHAELLATKVAPALS